MTVRTEAELSKIPKLVAMKIPWSIAPSTPCLRLIANENGEVKIILVAFFKANEKYANTQIVGHDKILVREKPDINNQIDYEKSLYQQIEITCTKSFWSKMSPAYSEGQVIEESKFDWSGVEGRIRDGVDPAKWLKEFQEKWVTTGICPDPGFYEVINSGWLQETDAIKYGLKHFLIVGEDSYIEIICDEWSWRSQGAVTNF